MLSTTKAIQYFQLAQSIAEIFSKDPSTKVGALIIAPKSYNVLSLGYNGMPRGVDEKTDLTRWQRPLKYELVEHAERNAIYNATRAGASLEGSIAIVTLFPCCDCARGLIQCGVKEIITTKTEEAAKRWSGKWKSSEMMLKEAGVNVIILTPEQISNKVDVTIKMPKKD